MKIGAFRDRPKLSTFSQYYIAYFRGEGGGYLKMLIFINNGKTINLKKRYIHVYHRYSLHVVL